MIEDVRELKVTINKSHNIDDIELILIAKAIVYNYSFSEKVPLDVNDLTFPLKFKVISSNENKIQYFTLNDIQSFENIHIIQEPLILMKKKY
jgi:uncharacterized protein (UPF0305 family)